MLIKLSNYRWCKVNTLGEGDDHGKLRGQWGELQGEGGLHQGCGGEGDVLHVNTGQLRAGGEVRHRAVAGSEAGAVAEAVIEDLGVVDVGWDCRQAVGQVVL